MKGSDLPMATQRVLGALAHRKAPMMGSEFLKEYRSHFEEGNPRGEDGDLQFRPQTFAVMQLDAGMRHAEEVGLIEYNYHGPQKLWRLTQAGLDLLAGK